MPSEFGDAEAVESPRLGELGLSRKDVYWSILIGFKESRTTQAVQAKTTLLRLRKMKEELETKVEKVEEKKQERTDAQRGQRKAAAPVKRQGGRRE